MPQAVAPAIVGGVAQLGGALIGSGAQKSAAKSQQRANDAAMQLERERMAEDRRRYDAYQQAQSQQNSWLTNVRKQILRKYGYDIPDDAQAATGGAQGAPAGLTLGQIAAGPMQATGGPAGGTLRGAPAQAPMAAAPMASPMEMSPEQSQAMTLGDIARGKNWADWRNYGAV